ncbi:MAG: hypothetical protein ABI175_11865 [Polyangiales bacterium]
MKLWGLGIGIIAAACTINGKSYSPGGGGGGGGGTSPTAPTTTTDSSGTTRSANGNQVGYPAAEPAPADGQFHRLPPYPAAPADPWRAVSGDQPKRWPEDMARYWIIRGNEYDCSAAHDHCIDPDAWFVVRNNDLQRLSYASVGWEVLGPNGTPASAGNARHYGVGSETEWTAFRTVPATKTNIAPGSAVIALDRGAGKLTNGVQSHDASWTYGVVDEVDLDGGFYTLKDRADSYKLWGARVVVLSWKPGGKVQIVGNKKRDQLAVKPTDVFLPE